ncbi:unnamed protein product [Spirodela intermedia]|uniref:MATH domain-containing protein n=1 Tax=Spirodela intermedia TaxID=51605 RepID=A0A7I8JLZ6_SPIIN|nr:unnamed protein product [Spirodela intermedia]CAA6670482.1 unnamed protein product [Spirodela intermedia]
MKETKASPPSSAAVSAVSALASASASASASSVGAAAPTELRQAPPSSPVAQQPEETAAPPAAAGRDGVGGQEAAVSVERRGEHSAVCRWSVAAFPRVKARALWSRYFEVGGYDCRLLVYPRGDSQALPGYLSVYLQIVDPAAARARLLPLGGTASPSKSIHRDSWHRFSSKKKSHGWCDFTPAAAVLDPRAGFLSGPGESLVVTADILVLDESVSFSRDIVPHSDHHHHHQAQSSAAVAGLEAPFTWKVHNFSLFREMIKTQKIMSPVFPAGECNLRISVYQSSVSGIEYLSMCLESKDAEKSLLPSDRSCWCLFRMSVLNQRQSSGASSGGNHVHKDSYGRFAADSKGGDNTSLGWNDYMKMADFMSTENGYLVDDTAVFSASFHVIKESSNFSKSVNCSGSIAQGTSGRTGVGGGARKSDGHFGKFTWRIENFTRLKDLLKKRKITGLCVKSRRFQIGNRDCRLIVYPRGQSQPPCHLSVFLEVTDSKNTSSDWSCFVSHRLSVVNQKLEEKSITKESQNRYSKAAKDWGWREFVTLTSLFDQDSGFLVQDTVIFSAEALASEDDQDALSTDPDELIDSEDSECVSGDEEDMFRNLLSRAGFHLTYGDNSSQPQVTLREKLLMDAGAIAGFLTGLRVYLDDPAKRLDHGSEDNNSGYAVQSSDLTANETDEKIDPVRPCFPSVTSAEDLSVDDGFIRSKTKWPEQSEELLGLIVNSLSALDSAVPQGCPEPRRRPQSVQKIALVLDKAPKHLQPDLVALVPKLVDNSEHSLAASVLIDCLQKPDKETELWMPVFGALNQLEFSPEVWQRALFQAFNLLADSNDELLVAAISFVFKAASQCQLLLTRYARAVRSRLKSLGPGVPQCVLDVLGKTVSTWADVTEAILRDIDSDIEPDGDSSLTTRTVFPDSVNALSMGLLSTSEEQAMLSIPAIFVDVSQVFVRAISRGAITLQSVAMVLERRHSQMFAMKSSAAADGVQSNDLAEKKDEALPVQNDDYTSFLNLGQVLSLSKDSRVQDFVRMLYAIMFKIYSDANHHEMLLKTLVDNATSSSDGQVVEIDMDVLAFLVRQEDGVAREVLNMLRKVCELAHVDRATLWHQSETELANFSRDKAVLAQRLSESEATVNRLKAETERFVRERKELSEQIAEAESQLEWARSERDEEVKKLSAERKVLQDRLHDAEVQLSQLKSRKRDELKRVVKEKNALAERLKSAEAARKRFDEELKRYATETQYIHTLEASLQEEMSRHAPLYGAGLEALSAKELETIARIHEEGLRQIHAVQQHGHGLPHTHSLYPTSAAMAVGLPPSIIPNGVGIHGNGQMNGGMGPWFNPS